MSKLEKIGMYSKDTGEEIGLDIMESIQKEEKRKELARIFVLMEKSPEKLSIEDIETYSKINNIELLKIAGFKKYHQTNDDFDIRLFNSGISMKSYYYFKYLVANYCGNKYTLMFANNKNITKDAQIQLKLNLSERQWREVKSELLKLNLIRIIVFDKKKYYKVNPCYVAKNKDITFHTYHAFREDLIANKLISLIQALYWDKLLEEEFMIKYAEKPQDIIQKYAEKPHSEYNHQILE